MADKDVVRREFGSEVFTIRYKETATPGVYVPYVEVSGGSTTITATVTPAGDDVVADGRDTVPNAGTRVQLGVQACKVVAVTAETDNTGLIVIGGATVVAALATRRGLPLSAGDSVTLTVDNVSRLFIDATVNTDGVTWAILA